MSQVEYGSSKIPILKSYRDFYQKIDDLPFVCFGTGWASVYLAQDKHMTTALEKTAFFVAPNSTINDTQIKIGNYQFELKPSSALKQMGKIVVLVLTPTFDGINNQDFLNITKEIHTINPSAICFDYKEIYAQGFFEQYSVEKTTANPSSPKFILINSLDTNNLGDHKIAIAQKYFLSKHFKNEIIEFPYSITSAHVSQIKKYINKNDIIIVAGGGYLNVFWRSSFDILKNILTLFPENSVILMPQTFYFENNEILLSKTKEVFARHPDFLICVRDNESFHLIRKNYPSCHVLLLPDIALSSPRFYSNENQKKGIGVSLRHDSKVNENLGLITKKDYNNLLKLLSDFDNVVITSQRDISVTGYFNLDKGKQMVDEKLKEIANYRLFVTDFLHGSIFSIIAGTPCISLANLTGKSINVYNTWLSKLSGIYMANHPEEITADIVERLLSSVVDYDDAYFQSDFQKLYTYISNLQGIESTT